MNKGSRITSNTQIVVRAKQDIRIMKVGHKIDPAFWQKITKRYESERDNNLNY